MPKYTVSVTNNSITLNVSGEDNSKTVQYYEYACKYPHQTGTDYVEHNNSQSSEYTFRGLESGALYTVNAKIHYTDGTSEGFIGGRTVVVGEFEGKASIVASDVGSNSCSVKLTELSVDYSGTERTAYWIFWELNDTLAEHLETVTLENGSSESVDIKVSGLNSNTEYRIYAMVFNSEGFLVTVGAETITTSGSSQEDTADFLIVEYNKSKHIIIASIKFDIPFPDGYEIIITEPDGTRAGVQDYSSVEEYYYSEISYEHKVTKSGTYIIQGFVFDNHGYYKDDTKYFWDENQGAYVSGKISMYIESVRPDLFVWGDKSNVAQDSVIKLAASDWNRLTDNINSVREYRGYPEFSFTFVRGVSNGYSESDSDKISAKIYNEAVEAIQGIDGYGTDLSYVLANNPLYYISADRLNALVSEINAVP